MKKKKKKSKKMKKKKKLFTLLIIRDLSVYLTTPNNHCRTELAE
jgi:hypothetical protein